MQYIFLVSTNMFKNHFRGGNTLFCREDITFLLSTTKEKI